MTSLPPTAMAFTGLLSMPPGDVTVSLVDNLEALEALRSSWSAMQSHPNSDIEFYCSVLRTWKNRCKPHVLVVKREGRPTAILVGRAETVPIECTLGYQTLFRFRARRLTFIYSGMLGETSAHSSELLIGAVRASLERQEADLAEFNFVRVNSDIYQSLVAASGIRTCVSVVQAHRSSEIGLTPEDIFGKMSSKRRRNLRNKKIQQDFEGRIKYRCFRDLGSMAAMLADVEIIASKTYHRQLGVGFDGSEELTNRLTAASACGRLRAYVLYLDNQPVAFWIATAYNSTLYSDFMGYDPAFGRYSPGMFLITRTLENLCTDPIDCKIRSVDWGLGDAQYKQVLGDTEWDEVNVKFFGPSAKGRAMELISVPIAQLDAWLKRVLANSGMLQKVKTNWRQLLVKKRSAAPT